MNEWLMLSLVIGAIFAGGWIILEASKANIEHKKEIFILNKRNRDYVIERGISASILQDIKKQYELSQSDNLRIESHLNRMAQPPFAEDEK